jgi:hypothetical protein
MNTEIHIILPGFNGKFKQDFLKVHLSFDADKLEGEALTLSQYQYKDHEETYLSGAVISIDAAKRLRDFLNYALRYL